MVVTSDDRDVLAYRIAAGGNVIGQAARLTPRANLSVNDIVWNGRNYVVTGVDQEKRVVAALLSSSASMSVPVVVREPRGVIYVERPILATDGTNTLVAWSEIEPKPCFPICDFFVDGINYRLLGPNLELLGDSPRMIVDNDGREPSAVYAGGEFAVVWTQQLFIGEPDTEIRGARIARDGRRVGPVFTIVDESQPHDLEAVSLGDRYAVSWQQQRHWSDRTFETRVVIVNNGGRVLSDGGLPRRRTNSTVLTTLPDGRVAYAVAMQQSVAPHHGASRVLLAVGSHLVPPPRPAAPTRLVSSIDAAIATLVWSPAPGQVNGYRVEYRVGDGAWNEIERWLQADDLTTTVRLPRTGSAIAFRVRAFNDAGAGPYSPVSGSGTSRRRAVR